jgi:glycosyltransferase involved in cell wall biosynthesis
MKILFCSLFTPLDIDGVSNTSKRLVSVLKEKGVDVTVYTTDWGWTDEEKKKKQNEKLRVFNALFNNNFNFSIEMFHHFYKTFNNFDLIHFNSIYSFATVFGAYYSRKYDIAHIIRPAGNFIPPSFSSYKIMRSVVRKKLFFKLFSRKSLLNANKIVCNSKVEMEALSKQVQSKNIMFIEHGFDGSPYFHKVDEKVIKEKLGINPDSPIFLFLGRLAREKAIPFLLDIWENVSKKIDNAVLVIAGSCEHGSSSKIEKKIMQLTHPESVVMPGVIKGDLKFALLQRSRCLLLPSYFESFGNVVLESLASGTPVIASIGTHWKHLKEYNFGKWLPWDIEIWQDAILEVSKNEYYQSEAFSQRSRQWVIENFNWDNVAEQYINLYEEILKKRQ